MANRYLSRDDAPFGEAVWEALDGALIGAARSVLTGRRILDVEGPYGLGLKAVTAGDREIEEGLAEPEAVTLRHIYRLFTIAKRDLAAAEAGGLPMELGSLSEAAVWCASREDGLVFHGDKGRAGLTTAKGVCTHKLSAWDDVGAAATDTIRAVTLLDQGGFHGPYAMALSPARYNALFRLYPRGNTSEMDHIRSIVSKGIYKAPALQRGGVLLATGKMFASIVLGQDMSLGFIGPTEDRMELSVSETVALWLKVPGSVCFLSE